MALAVDDTIWFDGAAGIVRATTSTLDANGRGSITYGDDTFNFRAIKCVIAGTTYAISTTGADAYLKVGLLQHPTNSLLFALVFDDPWWGRMVAGDTREKYWRPAGDFVQQDNCTFRMAWAPGVLTVKKSGTAQASKYVDFWFRWSTSDGDHEGWFQPAYPYAGWASNRGPFLTDANGTVEHVWPNGSTEPVWFPRGMGAMCHRESDTWPSAPDPERKLVETRLYFLHEHVTVTEGAAATLDMQAITLTVEGPPSAKVRVFPYGGENLLEGTLHAIDGDKTWTTVPPAEYHVEVYHPSDPNSGLPRQQIDCTTGAGSYTLTFSSSWTTAAANEAIINIYEYGAVSGGGDLWVKQLTGMPLTEIWNHIGDVSGSVTLDTSVYPGISHIAIEHPKHGACVCTRGRVYMNAVLGGRFAGYPAGSPLAPPADEGVTNYAVDGTHDNFPPGSDVGYLYDPTRHTKHWFRREGNWLVSETCPRWFHTNGLPEDPPAGDVTVVFDVYGADGTDTGDNEQLVPDTYPAWANTGVNWWESPTMGEDILVTIGALIDGAAWGADSTTEITRGEVPEVWRLGGEYGKWMGRPLEWRVSSENQNTNERSILVFDSVMCKYCGGPTWTDPTNATYTRWYCMECTDNSADTDCRSYARTITIPAHSGWKVRAVLTGTDGSFADKLVDGWPRPEEYDETAGYQQTLNGLTRYVASHITFGSYDGAFNDSESVADAEARLSRTVGPCMLKLKLTSPYSGLGKTVTVTATKPDGNSNTLTVVVPPGAETGDLFPLDWHPHHDYPLGYYTDVTDMTATGTGALYCDIVNDGPAWQSTTGVQPVDKDVVYWACDIAFGESNDPDLMTGHDGRVHCVYIRNGDVMHRWMDADGNWSAAVNVNNRANVPGAHSDPSIAEEDDGRLIVAAQTSAVSHVYISETDGTDWVEEV